MRVRLGAVLMPCLLAGLALQVIHRVDRHLVAGDLLAADHSDDSVPRPVCAGD